jgi:integrase
MLFGRPQLTHAHVTRKGCVYYFRRRLPAPYNGEIGLSLRTKLYREAEHLAHLLNQRLMEALASRQSRINLVPILREYLDELRSSYREAHRSTPSHQSVFGLQTYDEDPLDFDLAHIDEIVGELRERIARRDWGGAGGNLRALMVAHSIPEAQRIELAEGLLAVDLKALRELRERLLGNIPVPEDEAAGFRTPLSPSVPKGPVLSEIVEPFLAAMAQKKVRPWPDDDVRKARSVYSLFEDYCGDKSLSEYKRSEVYEFYRALALLPKHHGKRPRDRNKTMQERIADAEGTRLTAKTMEGYATKLIALFERHRNEDDLNWINPAEGFDKFEEIGEASISRKMWEGEPLQKLLQAPVWTGAASEARPRTPGEHVYANERYWLPILALYHGARLEELARLVRAEVVTEGDITYLNITDEDPPGTELERKKRVKTEAAKRRVPLHRKVLELGFLDYVERVAPKPDSYLFPRLKPDPRKSGHRSGKFSQWFTEYRRDAGIDDPRYVFHSFRAGVATKLLSASPAIPIGHIVALVGHEHEIAQAQNAQTLFANYLKAGQIPLAALQAAVNAVHFPEATFRKPTEYSDGTAFGIRAM